MTDDEILAKVEEIKARRNSQDAAQMCLKAGEVCLQLDHGTTSEMSFLVEPDRLRAVLKAAFDLDSLGDEPDEDHVWVGFSEAVEEIVEETSRKLEGKLKWTGSKIW